MAEPLTPLSASNQNLKTPTTLTRGTDYKFSKHIWSEPHMMDPDAENYFEDPDLTISSSPFVGDVDTNRISSTRNNSPRKYRSPSKQSPSDERAVPLTEHALRKNEELANGGNKTDHRRNSSLQYSDNGLESVSAAGGLRSHFDRDDTGFSSFSALPNTDVTMFAQLGRSPNKSSTRNPSRSPRRRDGARTPAYSRPTTPGTTQPLDNDGKSSLTSPTPRHQALTGSEDTTNLILDFTEQFTNNRSPSRNSSSPKKSSIQPDLTKYTSGLRRTRSPEKRSMPPHTPSSRHLANLLDFDITPAPTPRSVPSITPRELETLKSSFISQISSLRATLDGRETEINSLKKGIDEAERRAGDALEELHELKNAKKGLEADVLEWQKRDREMQSVLRGCKEELIHSDREREELVSKVSEADRRLSEAESILASLRAAAATNSQTDEVSCTPGSAEHERRTTAAMEKLARELHGAYQSKHENKVVALKRSYEHRWEKRIQDLHDKIEELKRENEELRVGKESGMSAVIAIPGVTSAASIIDTRKPSPEEEEARKQKADEEKVEAERQKAEQAVKMQTLADSLAKLSEENDSLRQDLDHERHEKSDLVAAVEEMLLIQASIPAPLAPSNSSSSATTSYPAAAHPPLTTSVSTSSLPPESFRSSIRASGLKNPGFGSSFGSGGINGNGGNGGSGESRIGMGGPKRTFSGNGPRSGIMGNIERMGRGRGE